MKLKAGQVYTKRMQYHPDITVWMKIRRITPFENHTFVVFDVWSDAPFSSPPTPTRPPLVKDLDKFLKENKDKGWTLT